MKKCDEAWSERLGLLQTLKQTVYQTPLNTVSKPPANQLPKALPKVLHKPVKNINKKASLVEANLFI